MPQFDTTHYFSQAFWLVVVFAFLYFMVWKYIVPRAGNILQSRDNYINSNKLEALSLESEIQAMKAQYESEIKDVNLAAQDLLDNTKIAMQNQFEKKKTELALEMREYANSVLHKIERDRLEISKESKPQCVELASLIITKVVGMKPDQKLLDKYYGSL